MICVFVGSNTTWSMTRSSLSPRWAKGAHVFPPSWETNTWAALVPRSRWLGSLGSYARLLTFPPSGPMRLQSEAEALWVPTERSSAIATDSMAAKQTSFLITTNTSPLSNFMDRASVIEIILARTMSRTVARRVLFLRPAQVTSPLPWGRFGDRVEATQLRSTVHEVALSRRNEHYRP